MKKLFLFALTVASLSACKKDSENTPSKTELLTAKSWRMSAYTSTTTVQAPGGTPSTTTSDVFNNYPACAKDDFLKFSTNKTLVQDDGVNKCVANGPQKRDYTWEFTSDQTKLLITLAGSSSGDNSDITELSATTLRLRSTSSSLIGNATANTVNEVTYTAF